MNARIEHDLQPETRVEHDQDLHPETRIEPLKLFTFWLIVGVPLSWGVWQVAAKSLVLFGIS